MILFIIVILAIALPILSWIRLIYYDAKLISFPGPFPLPFVGNGHLFTGDSSQFLQVLEQFSNTYGGISRFYIQSHRYVLLTDPKYIETVVSSTEMNTKGKSYIFLLPWLGQGLLTSSGIRWKTHRKFLTPAFHFNVLQNFLPIFLKNEKILITKLEKLANGKTIDLFPIIALAALDNVTESVMGVSYNAQTDTESEYVKSIEQLGSIVATRMRNPFAAVDLIFNLLPQKKIQDKALKILHGYSRKVIETRRKELLKSNVKLDINETSEHGIKNKYAFLDLLLLAELDGKIDEESIREEVDTFMFEGHDTTASGIVFTLYCISKDQEIQEKIMSEQKSILMDDIQRDPTYNEIQKMKYLEMVIKESLRLYPSVPLIERMTTKNIVLAGENVPKNTTIVIDILHMQRHPAIYEDPLGFHPERFETPLRNPFQWLAFSAGSRNCIGQKFAMMQMKVLLSAIVKKFIIIPCENEPIIGADLILRSQNGVQIKLKKRI